MMLFSTLALPSVHFSYQKTLYSVSQKSAQIQAKVAQHFIAIQSVSLHCWFTFVHSQTHYPHFYQLLHRKMQTWHHEPTSVITSACIFMLGVDIVARKCNIVQRIKL